MQIQQAIDQNGPNNQSSHNLTKQDQNKQQPIIQAQPLQIEIKQGLKINPQKVNKKWYSFIQWTVLILSLISSILTIYLTRNYWILQIIFPIDLDHHTSIIFSLKILAQVFSAVFLFKFMVRFIKPNSEFGYKLEKQLQNSVLSTILFLALCFWLYYDAKTKTNKKQMRQKMMGKICHYIAWLVIGKVSYMIGLIFGQLFSIRTLKTYGQMVTFISFLMVFSTLILPLISLQTHLSNFSIPNQDLFDMID